jgi:hypothetical protein
MYVSIVSALEFLFSRAACKITVQSGFLICLSAAVIAIYMNRQLITVKFQAPRHLGDVVICYYYT